MVRRWVVILGDQLDAQAEVLRQSDPKQDRIWMAEARQESTHVTSSKTRTVLFLTAMRHFAQHLREQGWTVDYQRIDDPQAFDSLSERLAHCLKQHPAQEVWVTAPGEWRVLQMLRDTVRDAGRPCRCKTTPTSTPRCVTLPDTPRGANNCAWNSGTVNCANGLAC